MSIYQKFQSLVFILLISILFEGACPEFAGSKLNQIDDKVTERFNLTNYTVFRPGSEVAANLYSSLKSGSQFHFRLFKIEEPGRFFTSTDRNLLRRNFDIWGKDRQALLQYTRLVKEWDAVINNPATYGENHNVDVGKISEPGMYILQAFRDNQVSYCGISVSNLAMIYKYSGKQILAVVVESKSGAVIPDAKFSVFNNDKLLGTKSSDKTGLALFSINDSMDLENQNALLMAETKDETIFSDPYFYLQSGMKEYLAYVYTNQPVYRPGQQVFFKAILREKLGDKLSNLPDKEFEIKIKTPKNKEVFSQSLKTNEFGSLSGEFKLDTDSELGTYWIQIIKGEQIFYGSFDVEEYKKPEYFVKVEPDKNHYGSSDTITASVSASYYFGSPVAGGKVSLKIYRQNYWRPWWYFSPYSWFYGSFNSERYQTYGERQFITEQTGELDNEGKFHFTYKISPDQNADYTYLITADVTDNSRSSVYGSANVFVTRGSFTFSTSPEKYFVPEGAAVDIRVNAMDFSDKPVQTKFFVVINYPQQANKRGNYLQPVSDTLSGATDTLGKAVVTFLPHGFYKGTYNYKVVSRDEKQRIITANNSFFVGTGREYYLGINRSNLEIITDKDSYEKGDSLTAYILLPQNNTDVLLTYEAGTFLGYEVRHADENSLTIKLKLTEKYSPSFNIAVAYMKDGVLYNTSKLVGVLDKDKFLNIAINPSKETYKPGDEASYKIMVSDNNGNPVKNTELSIGIIDESVYAIKEDQTPDIKTFFYAPKYSYIPTYSSNQDNYYFGSSRIATLADQKNNLEGFSPKGNGMLTGKLIAIKGNVDFKNIYVLLSSDSYFYKTEADSGGNFVFKNIKKDKYNLLALLDNNDILSAVEITVGNSSQKNIDLGNYMNISHFPQQIRFDGRVIPRVNAMMSEKEGMKSVTIATQQEMPGGIVQPVLRSNFVDAAIWKAHIVTDKNGEAQVIFKMPDNLTTWRATVRGITKNSDVGQSTGKIITRKNLLVRIETPRFFREGDELTVSTIVHNYLSESKKVKVNFDPVNLKIVGSRINQAGYSSFLNDARKRNYEINVDKDSEVRIDWNVKVSEPVGEAKIKAEALTNEESDAVELRVPILPAGIKKVEPVIADFTGDGSKVLEFNISPKIDLRTAKFSFSASPSLAGDILKALGDLAGYPYGCVEQTMSRFLPTIIVANTFKEIDAPLNDKIIKELPQMVDAGLKRLYNFQHSDGGWGWWTNDQTHPYMTAYVIYGMSLAKKAGYKVDSLSYNNGIKNLIEQIKKSANIDFTTKAFMIYSLSFNNPADTLNKDFCMQSIKKLLAEKLNSYSLSLLAITLHNFNEDSLLPGVLDRLIKNVVEESSFAYWGGKAWHYSWQDDKVQSTAFAAKALLLEKNNLPLITKAVRWLLNQKQGFSWRSTQETASVIFALTDYLKFTNELNPDFDLKVFVNNELKLNKKFSKNDIFENNPTVTIDGLNDKILKHGKNIIKIVKTGEGKLYFSGLNEFYSPDYKPAAKDMFTVSRNYFILNQENRGDKIVYIKQKLSGQISSGQILLVKTHVECSEKDLQYFILEDNLPSGFETVKDEKNFEIEGENDYHPINYWGIRPWRWFYADKEYHDDKVSFFVTNVQSQMDFSYIIQAQIPGDYNVIPSQCFLMYYPEVNGNSSPQKILVKE